MKGKIIHQPVQSPGYRVSKAAPPPDTQPLGYTINQQLITNQQIKLLTTAFLNAVEDTGKSYIYDLTSKIWKIRHKHKCKKKKRDNHTHTDESARNADC